MSDDNNDNKDSAPRGNEDKEGAAVVGAPDGNTNRSTQPYTTSSSLVRGSLVWLAPDNRQHKNDGSTTPNSSSIHALSFPPFVANQHIEYLVTLAATLSQPTSYEGAVTEHLRMSGIYWSWTALYLLLLPSEPSSTSSSSRTTTGNIKTDVETLLDKAINSCVDGTHDSSASPADGSDSTKNSTSVAATSIIDWVWSCYNDDGSFGGNTGHPGHILYTLSAIQILIMAGHNPTADSGADSKDKDDHRLATNRDAILQFVSSLQQPDGSFAGDRSANAEIDTRFTYCALSACALLGGMVSGSGGEDDRTTTRTCRSDTIDVPLAVDYIIRCRNLDGGFGSCVGAESHAGQVFCCVGALAIAEALHLLSPNDIDLLSWWLCERQVDSGGLNGRPEKQADVCYSWWILSCLSILSRISWINGDKLARFILQCQDDVDGGIADRPDDMADVFHTFFGIAGLSLLGHLHRGVEVDSAATDYVPTAGDGQPRHFQRIDPLYALPTIICQKLHLPGQVLATNQPSAGVDERLALYRVHVAS